MTLKYEYHDGMLNTQKKAGSPNAKVKIDHFYEVSIEFLGHNLVWLDLFMSEADADLSVSLAITDIKTQKTKVMIGEQAVPNGSFMSLFNHKLISDKIITVRSSKPVVVSYEARKEIQ